ncbi:protein brambleberry [Neodiprion pinetum]|uniref:protein brambleberry n=1 Tax=Neodiprion pinetum TaxID=441929 RepID=UPI001EE06A6B|nr:protein brambleberry-like isoform X1 [Neodiprion pinetum]XP_046477942.1 protein brambleberry-like isoform X1 [Neodiprion pinetum]
MRQSCFFVVLFTVLTYQDGNASIYDWVWSKNSEESNDVVPSDGIPLVSIPYESMTEDEKFLQEAAKFSEIQVSSALDTCQHKVVMKIKTSCSDMTEEELAKMSVSLLNCQSAAEGRKLFPCTEEMTLRQCTTEMDPDMWNAYHLMSNRARAVCYAARNIQFRALTEITVNKLMNTAHSQIKAMGSLKESQERLEEQTIDALNSVATGNKVLLEQQESLKEAQSSAHSLVARNLQILNNEKALIRSGHAQLLAMTDDIRKKLEKASQELADHSTERNENHQEVLADLKNMQEQAHQIWDRIESSTNHILEHNMEAAEQYEQTLKQLDQINQTVHFLLDLTNTLKTEVDQKLGWITNYIGDTGDQFEKVYRTGLHAIYLLIAMIVASFLQAPFLTRFTIMGILPLNLLSYLKEGAEASLDFGSITALIFLITGMHYLIVAIHYILRPKDVAIKPTTTGVMPSINILGANSTPINYINGNNVRRDAAVNDTKESVLFTMLHKILGIPSVLIYQANSCKNKLWSCVPTMPSWGRGNSQLLHEEMSCSYLPSKKSREELITDYTGHYPNMSDDMSSPSIHESRNLLNEHYDNYNESDDLVDATELRRRTTRNGSVTRSNFVYPPSPSRSNTPFMTGTSKNQCGALTRTGKRCRLSSNLGGNFCHRHSNGSSFMGD